MWFGDFDMIDACLDVVILTAQIIRAKACGFAGGKVGVCLVHPLGTKGLKAFMLGERIPLLHGEGQRR